MSRFDKTLPEMTKRDWVMLAVIGLGFGLFSYALGGMATAGLLIILYGVLGE